MAGNVTTPEIRPAWPADDLSSTSAVPDYRLYGQQDYLLTVCAFPSPAIQQRIYSLSQRLREEFPDHLYIPKDNLHIKIATLGATVTAHNIAQVQDQLAQLLCDIGARATKIEVIIQGISHFPNRFFAQVFDESEALDTLHESLTRISEVSARPPFVPHITIGYNKSTAYALHRYINTEIPWIDLGTDVVDTIHLAAFDTRQSAVDNSFEIIGSYALGH